jgi:hypothetical protein
MDSRRLKPRLLAAALTVLFLATGCWQRPLREGAQMREFPEGFRFEDNVQAGADLFPRSGRLPIRSYVCMNQDDQYSDISMSEYPVVLAEAEVRAAYDGSRARRHSTQFGEFGPLRIGERDGWGWTEKQLGRDGRVLALKWSAVVPYDDRTFLLEYYSTMPKHMDLAAMRAQFDQFAFARDGRLVK